MHNRAVAIAFTLVLLLTITESEIPLISAMPVEAPAPALQSTDPGQSTPTPSPPPLSAPTPSPETPSPPPTSPQPASPAVPSTNSSDSPDAPAPTSPVEAPAKPPEPPDDPCLPHLYKDWREVSLDNEQNGSHHEFAEFRIHIDRSNFELTFEGIHRDGSVKEIYRTHVGLGDIASPTPEGKFLINHVYCYPDVVYFDPSGRPFLDVYEGFFAPLLLCDEQGRCERHRDLGLHGYHHQGSSDPQVIQSSTYGAISAGCIRLPDPCGFKACLIRSVGIGPLKRNDRGSYHWLNKPVEVDIDADYPGGDEQLTLLSLIREGAAQVQDGLKSVLDIFYH
jgi:L,D-transpeptidase catalytic domain